MSEKEILSNRLLIAAFMGYKPSFDGELFDYPQFNYEKSWDAMMPVVRKINNLGKDYNFTIHKNHVSLSVGSEPDKFSFIHSVHIADEETHTQTDLDAVFTLVVKFLNWYNSNILDVQKEGSNLEKFVKDNYNEYTIIIRLRYLHRFKDV